MIVKMNNVFKRQYFCTDSKSFFVQDLSGEMKEVKENDDEYPELVDYLLDEYDVYSRENS